MDNIKQWEGWCIGLNRREFLIEGIGRLCLLNYMSLRVDTNIRYNFLLCGNLPLLETIKIIFV